MSTVWHGFLFGVGFCLAGGIVAGAVGFAMLELIGRAVTRWRSQNRGVRVPVRPSEADEPGAVR